ncbi:MAG: tetratricopeptide repeat protein [Anaerolineae bacterium]|nr:tetratricopeptide repeat protein [Anaerolineae bacterium]
MEEKVEELVAQAREAYRQLDLQKALELYEKARELAPEDYRVHLGLARTLTRMRRPQEAIEAAQRCVELAPERYEGYTALGVLYFLADENEKALEVLRKAHELAPEAPEPLLTLAQVYADMGRFEEASVELARARDLIEEIGDEKERNALLAMVWHVEAYVRLAEGRNTEARECAQQVIALAEANPYAACLAYSNLGILEARERRYAQAIEYLDKAFQMNPFFYRAGSALGRLLIVRGQPERAVEVLEQVLKLNPDDTASTRYAYAVALAKAGERKQALAQFRQALEEGLSGGDKLFARWQVVWLSDWGRYTIIGLALVAVLVWILVGRPSPQTLTLVAVFAVVFFLQRLIGRKKRFP